MATTKGIEKLANDRTQLVDKIVTAMEKRVTTAQSSLLRIIVSDFVDKLDRDGDVIKNTMRNKRLVGLIDTVYNRFATQGKGAELTAAVVGGMDKILNFNDKYYSSFGDKAKLNPISSQVRESMGDWLGLTKNGKAQPNGYIDTLIKDPSTAQAIKDMSMSAIVGQQGYNATKNALKDYIEDTPTGTGRLRKYYRNFVYDKFSQADRTSSKIYADKLKLNYAIYEGGLIKTSRQFCKDRNGKVFSRAEIAEFDPHEARPPGYNPFTDLGGYGCRHHLNWIPDAVAFALRPELRNAPTPTELPEPTTTKVMGKVPPVRPANNLPYSQVKAIPVNSYNLKVNERVLADENAALESQKRTINAERTSVSERYAKAMAAYPLIKKSDARAELNNEIAGLLEESTKLRKKAEQIEKKQDKLNETFRDNLLSGLSKSNQTFNSTSTILTKNKKFLAEQQKGIDFFRAVSNGYREDVPVGIKAANRDREYSLGDDIFVTKNTNAGVIIHELAHTLENNSTIFKSAVDFLEKRTKGSDIYRLNDVNAAYGMSEIYRKGGFRNPYVGRVYGASETSRNYKGLHATEVISLGLEWMYKDPLGFYREDREHFEFIYSLFFQR